MYIGSRWLLLLQVLNSFFKQTLKLFFFLPFNQAFILERFILEYHIFEYLTWNGNLQNHVDNNIFLPRCSCHYLFPEHQLSCVFMRVIINFMFNIIIDETAINDGIKFVHISMMSLLSNLFLVPPPIWAKTPFIATSFLSLSLFFGLSGFQWEHSLECAYLLHWTHIASICFPLLTFSYLVNGSNF